MATQILATGSTAASSADVVVSGQLAVSLKGVVDGGLVTIELKDDAGGYNAVGTLTPQAPSAVITAAGTYRFTRRVGATCGVFSG